MVVGGQRFKVHPGFFDMYYTKGTKSLDKVGCAAEVLGMMAMGAGQLRSLFSNHANGCGC